MRWIAYRRFCFVHELPAVAYDFVRITQNMLSILVISLLLRTVAGAGRNVTLPSQCSCGYRDPSTKELYTETIILYFNETGVDTDVFQVMNFANRNQKGWNAVFRQGASPSNIMTGNNGKSYQTQLGKLAPAHKTRTSR